VNKRSIESLPLQGKKVLVRVDFNVPLKDGAVTDDTRIQEALPTLRYLLEKNCKILLCSHLGRPKGTVQSKYSLEPVAKKLSQLLGQNVLFVKDCVGPLAQEASNNLKEKEILLLENLRFHSEEEKNDPVFAKELGNLADYFVQDAFGAVHRAHASTSSVTKIIPSAIGFLVKKEIAALGKIVKSPEQPFLTILGGAKVSDKIEVIQNLSVLAETILIGGGMSYTFLKANGFGIGNSLLEEDKISFAKSLDGSGSKLKLPLDHIVTQKIEPGSKTLVTPDQNIQEGWIGVDIGPKSIQQIDKWISTAKTIFWNGPLGIFEIPEFSKGTIACAKAVAQATLRGAYTVVGGGDSIAALNACGMKGSVSHVSTGGGASLEFIEGKSLPGIEAIPNS